MPGCVSGAKNQTTATLTALCLRLNHSSTPVMTEETHRESQVAVASAPLKGQRQSNAHVTPGRQSNACVTPGIMDTANSSRTASSNTFVAGLTKQWTVAQVGAQGDRSDGRMCQPSHNCVS